MELYHGVRSPRLKKDWRFGLAVGTAALLILLVTVPLFFSARLFYRHHGFVRDLSSALVHSQTLPAAYGEERWNVSAGSASRLFTLLVDAGAGRPDRRPPAGKELSLDLGGGICLSLWPLVSADEPGVWISFTRSDGSVFTYSTEKLQFDRLLALLRS